MHATGALQVRFFRIGDKVVSREKLVDELTAMLEDRESGATQLEVALSHGVQRSFVSWLESLGEVRRGPKVALVAFPVANADEVRRVAEERALEFVMVFSQTERETLESGDASQVFNQSLEVLAELRDYDVVVLMASDWRIRTVEKILGRDVVGVPLGHSPLREDVPVDLAALGDLLDTVTALPRADKKAGTAGEAAARILRRATGAARAGAKGWSSSKKS